jgi:hypothetical protein
VETHGVGLWGRREGHGMDESRVEEGVDHFEEGVEE